MTTGSMIKKIMKWCRKKWTRHQGVENDPSVTDGKVSARDETVEYGCVAPGSSDDQLMYPINFATVDFGNGTELIYSNTLDSFTKFDNELSCEGSELYGFVTAVGHRGCLMNGEDSSLDSVEVKNSFATGTAKTSSKFDVFCSFIRLNKKLPDHPAYKYLKQYEDIKKWKLKNRALAAIEQRKVFTVTGTFPLLTKLLLSRGWVAKLTRTQEERMLSRLAVLPTFAENNFSRLALSLMVGEHPPNLLWTTKCRANHNKNRSTFLNRMQRTYVGDVTTMCGLLHVIQNADDMPLDLNMDRIRRQHIPRSYILSHRKQRKLFVQDNHIIRCLAFVDHLYRLGNLSKVFTMKWSPFNIDADVISYALKELRLIIQCDNLLSHVDETYANLENNRQMYISFQLIIANKTKFRFTNQLKSMDFFEAEIGEVMDKIKKKFPNVLREGLHNLWIIKPNERHRGAGLVIANTEEQILELHRAHPERNYVVQKYLERPCLIAGTKFDIRLFTLLTFNGEVVSIWMYKNCYLKFCSETFSLTNLDESRHMTNHSVQRNHQLDAARNPKLPSNNMWSLEDFLKHLRQKHHCNNLWHQRIYPAIVKTLIMVLYASLSETHLSANTFELIDADFILTDELVPKLLELNGSPSLSGSTAVSRAVCNAVQKDLLCVIIDVEKDKNADTGDFEKVISIVPKRRLFLK